MESDAPEFDGLLDKMGKKKMDGTRAVILLDIFKVRRCSFATITYYMSSGY